MGQFLWIAHCIDCFDLTIVIEAQRGGLDGLTLQVIEDDRRQAVDSRKA